MSAIEVASSSRYLTAAPHTVDESSTVYDRVIALLGFETR